MRIVLAGATRNPIVAMASGGCMPRLEGAATDMGCGDAACSMQPGSIGLGVGDIVRPIQRASLSMLEDVPANPEPFSRPTAMSIDAMFFAVGVFMRITRTARQHAKGRE